MFENKFQTIYYARHLACLNAAKQNRQRHPTSFSLRTRPMIVSVLSFHSCGYWYLSFCTKLFREHIAIVDR